MSLAIKLISDLWGLFWSLWPKNFLFLVIMSAICEGASVTFFRLSGNRGVGSIIGFILGFFVVAFYAEATKYAKIAHSYPIYLAAIAICISIASIFVLREKVTSLWAVGFIFVLIGITMIQFGLPE